MINTDTATTLLQWLTQQSFTPPLRSMQAASGKPCASYPCLTVLPVEERFTQGGTDVAHAFILRLECSAGRLGEAQAQARQLARQLRSALHLSHGLGGAVRAVRTEGIDYTQRDAPGAPVVAVAQLHVAVSS